jgi:hypothetical protein
MAKPIFEIKELQSAEGHKFRLVKFEVPGGVTTPTEFAEAVQAIESHPRLGYVITQTHDDRFHMGQVLDL